MAEILTVFTVSRRLFAPDTIPWPQLIIPHGLERVRDRYKFSQLVPQLDAAPQIVGDLGQFSVEGAHFTVEQFLIQPNALQFQISGDTSVADRFFADFATLAKDLDSTRDVSAESQYTSTYQTIAVAKLSVPFGAMFSRQLREFLETDAMRRLEVPDAEVDVSLAHLTWGVTYRMKTKDFVYLPKALTIEPRGGAKSEEQVYYTVSQTDTKTHKELLLGFEKAMAGQDGNSTGRQRRKAGTDPR